MLRALLLAALAAAACPLSTSSETLYGGNICAASIVGDIAYGSRIGTGCNATLHVSAFSGNDSEADGSSMFPYRTLGAVLHALAASSATPYAVHVHPGTYMINNTGGGVLLPAYVIFRAELNSVILEAADPAHPMLLLHEHTIMMGFKYTCPANSACFQTVAGNDKWGLYDVNVLGGGTFLDVASSSGTFCFVHRLTVASGYASACTLYVHDGGFVHLNGVFSRGSGAFLCISGVRSRVIMLDMHYAAESLAGSAICINASAGARVEGDDITITRADYGVVVDSGARVDVSSIFMSENVSVHVRQASADAAISVKEGEFTQDRLDLAADLANVHMNYRENEGAERAQKLTTEMWVGMPERGRETLLGEGDSYTRGMLVYYYNASVYSDRTASVRQADDGAGLSMAFATSVCVYVTTLLGSGVRVPGLQIKVDAAAGGEPGWAFWSGAAWEQLHIMTSRANGTYLQRGRVLLTEAGWYQVRFSDVEVARSVAADPLAIGKTGHWVRMCYSSAGAPDARIDQIKVHANAAKINSDGFVEYFGTARPVARLPLLHRSWEADDMDLYYDSSRKISKGANKYDSASSKSGTFFVMPMDIDTSCPLRITFYYATDTADSFPMMLHASWISAGSAVGVSGPITPSNPIQEFVETWTAAAPDVLYTRAFNVSVNDMIVQRAGGLSGDMFVLSLEAGAAWPAAEKLAIANVVVFYTQSVAGAHSGLWV